jgi:hypothetical protein
MYAWPGLTEHGVYLRYRSMKFISTIAIALSLLSFVPVTASAEWEDTSKGGQQRWAY